MCKLTSTQHIHFWLFLITVLIRFGSMRELPKFTFRVGAMLFQFYQGSKKFDVGQTIPYMLMLLTHIEGDFVVEASDELLLDGLNIQVSWVFAVGREIKVLKESSFTHTCCIRFPFASRLSF